MLARALTTGAVIGCGVFAGQRYLPFLRRPSASASASARLAFLRTAGKSAAWTLGLSAAGLAARMHGRDDIEWRDRAWRLLESPGQLETDDWTCAGAVAGLLGAAAGAARAGRPRPSLGVAALGAAGAGSFVGTVGYLGWRYGVNGGRFPDRGEDGRAGWR